MTNTGLNVYLLFGTSWFLHLGARIPVLGIVRFDLLLVCLMIFLATSRESSNKNPRTQTDSLLRVLIAYSILTIPFVEWPGSVIKSGLPNLIKAIVFYYFTIAFIKTEKDLKQFLLVFLACQSFRILEPLYLHITQDYWGSVAHMADWSSLDRLSGAPHDVVNPNGLAFIICTVLPFLYCMAGISWRYKLACIVLIPVCLYTLSLTGSRSGIIGLVAIVVGILIKSKNRVLLVAACVAIVVIGFPLMPADMQDRYLSIVGKGEKNAATAEERTKGLEAQFLVALRKPLFGHGLGTSHEANTHFSGGPYAGKDLPAHNLYMEIAQELGFTGLIIFLLLMKSIYSGFAQGRRLSRQQRTGAFLPRAIDAMQVWLIMNFVFSFASYGLSSYEWYLFGGFSVVLQRLARNNPVDQTGNAAKLPMQKIQ